MSRFRQRIKNRYLKILAFFGCLFNSVGYMDPGNWATDFSRGIIWLFALWVLLMSNLMALLQSLS
jgi:Mn2+/Fe2+ NRAMP family transporter